MEFKIVWNKFRILSRFVSYPVSLNLSFILKLKVDKPKQSLLTGPCRVAWGLLNAMYFEGYQICILRVTIVGYRVERAMRAGFETKQFIKFMCVHFGRIINCDRICIEFRVDKFYQHKFFGCDIKIYWCVLMPRLNEFVGDRSSLFNLKKIIHSFNHSFILGSGLSYTLPCLRPGLINQSSNPNAYIAGTMEPYNYGHP